MTRKFSISLALGLFCLLQYNPCHARTITVAGITLKPCVAQYDGYCGSIVRALDPNGHMPGTIVIGFELYPHTGTAKPSLGTIVAQEGGPGYSTTDSRDGYVRLFAPLRDRRDILLIDKRGTGRSGAIDCHAIQNGRGLDAARACGRQLGRTAWLYGSANAADDVAAVLTALHTGPVDYYGDSYGTFFGEVFAARHPDLLRTMVLDSAYPVLGQDVFFETEITHGPKAFALACARSPGCDGAHAEKRFEVLLAALRKKPVTGRAPDSHGQIQTVTANPGALFTIAANAGNSFTPYRDIDAAARAYLDQGDATPLLRLVAEATGGENSGGPANEFSSGLELAVICADYKQLYDMRASEAQRHAQYLARISATQAATPALYAPFTVKDSVNAAANPDALDLCQAWPPAPPNAAPGKPVPDNAMFPKIPVLVLSGELDTVTSLIEGKRAAALFPNATYILVPNTVHESAIGNGGFNVPPYGADLAQCAGPIVLAFVKAQGKPPDTSCLSRIRPVRTVPKFAVRWQDVAPATAQPGNSADAAQLKLASAAAETVGDAVARYGVAPDNIGLGLRGGRFTVSQTKTGNLLKLEKLKWTNDLEVSGTIDWNQNTGVIVAAISLATTGHTGKLKISWNDRQTNARAAITGQIDGQSVAAARIAP
ncbi:MAG TPA: alpha/beta fold hydrolase [Rhizomicrobium sp.]|jgi:pimeloyl-ACP methyl ester carboxylesterase|nr:alpha/beta fold hydrolase [Rhizomicrobium sp.]